MSFCLYIAARVFVQYLKSRPEDSSVHSSLQFLVSALNAMKNKNPLTESFLVQLDVDLDGTGIRALDDKQIAKNAANSMLVSPPRLFLENEVNLMPFSLSKIIAMIISSVLLFITFVKSKRARLRSLIIVQTALPNNNLHLLV